MRSRIALGWLCCLTALALCLAGQPVSLSAGTPAAPAPATREPGQAALAGTFAIVWGDPVPGGAGPGRLEYRLHTDGGEAVPLLLDEALARPYGGVHAFNGRRVAVAGERAPSPDAGTALRVEAIQPLPGPDRGAAEGLVGSQPWVSLMCKFADFPGEPKDLAYFQGMYASTFPGQDHYWREVSYNAIDVQGSAAVGWYTLPQPWSYYVYDQNGDGQPDLNHGRAAADCTAVADPDVYFPDFVGINLMFNTTLDCCAWGGGWYMDLDGVGKVYRMTWEPPWGYENVTVISHEMGHGFGMPHSSGDYGQVYDNAWDVMSGAWAFCENQTDPVYGCVGQDTITYHLGLEEWIAPGLEVVVPAGSQATVQLEQLDLPQTANPLVARVPVGDSPTHFFTVEARRKAGYDLKLPGEGVIVHEVITDRPEPAHVVDADGNGNTGDAGAIWEVGETFTDPASGIWVRVDSALPTGWTVTISNPPLTEIQVNSTAQSPGEPGDCTLGEAIQAANADAAVDGCTAGNGADRIQVPAGSYVLSQADNTADGPNGLPDITSTIHIQGAGREGTVLSRPAGAPAFRLVHVGPGGSLDASGIALTGGDAGDGWGGGVYAAGDLALNDCAVSDNHARRGGGLYVAPGAVAELAGTELLRNASALNGAALYSGGSTSLAGCRVADNTSGADTGTLHNEAGLLALSSTSVEDNTAPGYGGGVSAVAGVTSVDGCTFAGNSGSQLFDNSGLLQVTDTTVQGGPAGGSHGIACWYGTMSVSGAQIYDNEYGAVAAYSTQPLSVNDTCIAGNGGTSVDNIGAATMDATGNWWGAPDGPSGQGSGHGDSVSANVLWEPFLQKRPAHCAALPPQADFSGTPTDGPAPLEVEFTNHSTGEFDACTWDFGDGGSRTGCGDPAYTYAAAGEYTVTLTVSGLGGSDTEVKPEYVRVLPVYRIYLPAVVR